MHNYFLFTDQILTRLPKGADALGDGVPSSANKVHIVSNERGFIATVQSMKFVNRDAYGRVLNDNGEVVAAVHQVRHRGNVVVERRG